MTKQPQQLEAGDRVWLGRNAGGWRTVSLVQGSLTRKGWVNLTVQAEYGDNGFDINVRPDEPVLMGDQ